MRLSQLNETIIYIMQLNNGSIDPFY